MKKKSEKIPKLTKSERQERSLLFQPYQFLRNDPYCPQDDWTVGNSLKNGTWRLTKNDNQ